MISVIIPSYQHGKTLAACLASVLMQTVKEIEIIVVDDGSTDDTAEAVKPFLDKIVYIHQTNQGGNVARNVGFKASYGEQVIFCDADIIMQPEMLQKMLDALAQNPQAQFAYSRFHFGWKGFSSYPFDAERLRQMNYIHTTSLICRDAFPGFDETIKRFQDWDVWLTILERGGSGIYIPEELFRINDDHGRKGISQWQPSFMYCIPWSRLPWMPKSIRNYLNAREIIRTKHHLYA